MQNILAIDIGHGHTKSMYRPGPGMYTKTCFPSFATQVPGGADSSAIMASGLDVVNVEVEGNLYRIGRDIVQGMPAGFERNRDDNYALTPGYLALVRG